MGIDLDPQARARVDAELEPGEHLLWAGTGRVDRRGFDAVARLAIPQGAFMGLVFIGFASVLGFVAIRIMQSPLTGIGVAVIALLFLSTPLLAFRRLAGRMMNQLDVPLLYALTDRRALVWAPTPLDNGMAVRSFAPDQMNALLRIDRPDGTGDLIFQESVGGLGQGPMVRHGFYGIQAPATVERLLRQVRERRITQPQGPDQDSNLESI